MTAEAALCMWIRLGSGMTTWDREEWVTRVNRVTVSDAFGRL